MRRGARPPPPALATAIRIVAWESQSGVPCALRIDPDLRLPPGLELQLVRIIHEALANVRKHARAHRAEVQVERAGGAVVARVEDDGIGFNPDELDRAVQPRFGLATMRERAESVGGSVRLDSAPGRGTCVKVEIPLHAV